MFSSVRKSLSALSNALSLSSVRSYPTSAFVVSSSSSPFSSPSSSWPLSTPSLTRFLTSYGVNAHSNLSSLTPSSSSSLFVKTPSALLTTSVRGMRRQAKKQIPPAVSVNRKPDVDLSDVSTLEQIDEIERSNTLLLRAFRRQLTVLPNGKLRRFLRSKIKQQVHIIACIEQHKHTIHTAFATSQSTTTETTTAI